MSFTEHAIHQLYKHRKSLSTKPYASRGKNQLRCELCLLPVSYCTCQWRQLLVSKAAFLLIMYDDEVLKPSNSGRLVADLIPQTHAFIWSRTQPNEQMLALINNDKYQPFVVFPSEYAGEQQTVLSELTANTQMDNQTPLFILLDGSWREAKKMFRKSSYLQNLPLLSFTPDTLAKYGLRKNSRDFQLGTAEVAALVLQSMGEHNNAYSLDAWMALFRESSLHARTCRRADLLRSIDQLQAEFLQTLT
jgi:DTW domain-containing protein YfiP